jgi:glutathione S-transferase
MAGTDNAQTDRVTIYHIEGRRSFRVIWLCEELGIPYDLVFKRGDVLGSMVQLRKEYPLMPMAPTIRLRGEFMVESGAILDVLVARYGRGQLVPPVESSDYLKHAQWMHFAEATAMSRMATDRFVALATGVEVTALPDGYRLGEPIDKLALVGSRGIFDYIEDYLSKNPYFGGAAFTAADIMMHYAVRGAKLLVWIDAADYPNVAQWKRKVEARPAFERATQTALPGGADEFGLPVGFPLPFSPPPKKTAAPDSRKR